MGHTHWIIVILLFSLIFVSGCTSYQSKYEVGDVITNVNDGEFYGLYIVGIHGGTDSYLFQNVTRCGTTNNSQWKYVGDDPRRDSYISVDFNPLISKIDQINLDFGISGPYRTVK